ncbi:MAG: TetR/AcrR family transcriptional regulator [Clostridiales bacterium]|nr:TetR/AcrR family transcriptional regulator [Clostridiales bacterium]MDY3747814.1 TetR/AcrR family transcriptional regulator [Lachnospiraceae bacterium]
MRQTSENVSPMSNEGRNQYVVEHITQAMLKLMKNHNFNEISISQICDEAGVGRASFYRNFESKEAVISRYLKKLLDNWWIEAIQKPDFNLVEAVFSHYWNHRELCIMLYKQGLAHLSLQSIREACGPKPEQPNIVAYATAYFSYGLYGWIEEWFKRGMQETPKEMAMLWEATQKAQNQVSKERSE